MIANRRLHDVEERIGDIERDVTCDELAKHFASGRLSEDEMQQRTSAAIMARTRGDLYALLADLPRTRPQNLPNPIPIHHPDGRRSLFDLVLGFFSVAAVLCFCLVFLGTAVTHPIGALLLFLGALAGIVATSGVWHFSRGVKVLRECRCPHCTIK